MANLLQEPFKDWVKKQIEVRQKVLGKYNNISENDIKFYSTSTPFIRLASSVNLTETETIELAYITDIHKAKIDSYVARGATKEETLKDYYIERSKIAPTLTGRETIQRSNFTFPLKNHVLDKLLNSNPKLTREMLLGDALAKNFILQGGVSSVDNVQKNGFTSDNPFKGAYGWGGIQERGYIPMPGILNAQIKYQNNGALSTTTIKIKAFSREQFSLIDALYMRPGYNLLLEFGHSVYIDNEGKLKTWDNFVTNTLSRFLEGNIDQYEILNLIKLEREKYNGNYEAVFGKITKFKWFLNKDGSYDIEIKLTGNGDVIENLKINLQQDDTKIESTKVAPEEGVEEEQEQTDPPLVADREKSSLNRFIYRLSNFKDTLAVQANYNAERTIETTNTYQTFNSTAEGKPLPPFDNFPRKQEDGKYIRKSEINSRIHVLQQFEVITDGGEKSVTQTYIQFIHLLAFIESELMLYDGDTPLTRFDFNYYEPHKDQNYMLTFPGQFSSDPRVCIIPLTNNIVNGLESIIMRPSPNQTPPNYIEDKINEISHFTTTHNGDIPGENSLYIGRLGGIYVNANFIAETLANTEKDEKGNISILDFLNTLLQKISEVLGGINQFRVTFDEESGTIRFYEDAPQRFNNPILPEYAKLNVYGVSPNEGSFVKDINLDSELSNNFATQISVGAQAGGNELSVNATSFSAYNKGLEDRIIKTKTNKPSNTAGRTSSPKETLVNNWGTPYSEGKIKLAGIKVYVRGGSNTQEVFTGMLGSSSTTYNDPRLYFTSEYIDMLNEFNKQYASVIIGSSQQDGIISNFFLPFNLKLTINGMSGMVLYQQFSINTKILPATYDEIGVNYIIKSLNHNITLQGWETEIETTPISLPKTTPISSYTPISSNIIPEQKQVKTAIQPPSNPGDEFLIYDNITDGGVIQYPETFGKIISIKDLTDRMHPKSRPKFILFFNELKNKYPGYTARVNSMGRGLKISQDFRLSMGAQQPWAGGSKHNYFMAIDMNIILPSGVMLRKSEGVEDWLNTGIPDIAKKYGIEWGNYKNYKDYVHFGIPFNLDNAKEQLSKLYPKFIPNSMNDESLLSLIDKETKAGGGINKIQII